MDSVTKICRRCEGTKPTGDFHRNSRTKDGLQAYCKPCNSRASADRKRQRVNTDPTYRAELSAYKRAYYLAHQDEQIAYAQKWRGDNPERVAEQRADYKAKHWDRLQASSLRWKAANKSRVAAIWAAWYEVNREAVAARSAASYRADPEKGRAFTKAWRQKNPDAAREQGRRRLAMKKAATILPFSLDRLQARIDYYNGKCWMCGAPFAHVDHVKPLAKGGPHMLSNLRPACGSCNQSKSAKWFGTDGLSRFIKI